MAEKSCLLWLNAILIPVSYTSNALLARRMHQQFPTAMVTVKILTATREPVTWIQDNMGHHQGTEREFYVWDKEMAENEASQMSQKLADDARLDRPAFEAAFIQDKSAPGGFSLIAGEMLARRRRALATLPPLSATPREIFGDKQSD